MKRIWRMAGVVTVCMALGFATLGADIQTVYAQEEVRGAGAQTAGLSDSMILPLRH